MTRRPWLLTLLVMTAFAAACGSKSEPAPAPPAAPSPSPTPAPQPTPPPTPAPNQPPVIDSIRFTPQYPEFRTDTPFEATVRDGETPVDKLKLEWSATLGTFTGSGTRVIWRVDQPPLRQSPVRFDVTLKVTEDLPSGTNQSVSKTVTATVNDSYKEAIDLANQFLTDFTNPNASPEFVVRNFSDRCPAKREEMENVRVNRALFIIDPVKSKWTIKSVTFDEKLPTTGSYGNVTASCTFVDIRKATGQTEVVPGTCFLDTFFDAGRWTLCDSRFQGTPPTPTLNFSTRGLHP